MHGVLNILLSWSTFTPTYEKGEIQTKKRHYISAKTKKVGNWLCNHAQRWMSRACVTCAKTVSFMYMEIFIWPLWNHVAVAPLHSNVEFRKQCASEILQLWPSYQLAPERLMLWRPLPSPCIWIFIENQLNEKGIERHLRQWCPQYSPVFFLQSLIPHFHCPCRFRNCCRLQQRSDSDVLV